MFNEETLGMLDFFLEGRNYFYMFGWRSKQEGRCERERVRKREGRKGNERDFLWGRGEVKVMNR